MCIRTDARGLDLGFSECGYTSTDDCQHLSVAKSTPVCSGVAHSIGAQS